MYLEQIPVLNTAGQVVNLIVDASSWPEYLIHQDSCVKEHFSDFIAAFLPNTLILKVLRLNTNYL